MRLIEKVWFYKHPAKWLLVPLLLPVSALFYLLSTLRRICFNLGITKSFKISKPVIVVGNIGVGGNGKTPVVIFLIEVTRALGLRPGVISRGYGGEAPIYPYLLDETSTAKEAGDEPVLIKNRCQVPVAVGSDRIASAKLLVEKGCNIIISDDGLQHYRLKRDVELVVIDGKRLFGNGLLLPSGPLREGQWRLKKSDLIIYNGHKPEDAQQSSISSTISEGNSSKSQAPELLMTLVPKQVCNLHTKQCMPLSDFIKKHSEVNAVAGIGDPQRFFDTLTSNSFNIKNKQSFVDHHKFSINDFKPFDANIPLLMTEKDAVKCDSFCQEHWWYLPVDANFNEQEQQIIIDKIKSVI